MNTKTVTAESLTAGQYFTDYMGHSYTVTRIEDAPGGAGVYVYVMGQGYPEFYTYGTPATVSEAPARRVLRTVDPKPFYVLTRKYRANGDCIKGGRRFATRAAQQRYISRAPMDVAITAYN